MVQENNWQKFSNIFKDLLGLEQSPVSVTCLKHKKSDDTGAKVRICRAILDAAGGKTLQISKENNACFGASWHLGFHKINDKNVLKMIKKFVVEGEKLFSSYEALEKLILQMEEVPNNSNATFLLTPLEKAQTQPQLIIFVCNPEQACRLLTFLTFIDGVMPKIKIGGPTCRLIITYPLLKDEANISFYDYTARKMCNVGKDKLLVAIPYKKIPQIIESIDKCSAGRAKIEYPQDFRQFLKSKLIK